MLSPLALPLILNIFEEKVLVRLFVGPPGPTFEENPAAEAALVEGTFPRATVETAPTGLRNSTKLVWPEVKATETYTHFALLDPASHLGAIWGQFTEPVAVTKGDLFEIPAGALVITAS